MVGQAIAWVFNLDAEEELRHPGRHGRSPAMRQRLSRWASSLQQMTQPGDVLVGEDTVRLQGDYLGQAWCPTPTARERLRQVGARLPAFPPVDVLRRVNHRRFHAELGQTLPDGIWAEDLHTLQRHVRRAPHATWLLKRPYGFSGRHRLRSALTTQSAHEQRWILASFRHGDGLQVEPWVERVRDTVVHGWCHVDGTWRLGDVAVQECDVRGAWQRTRPATAGEIDAGDAASLRRAAGEAAAALVRAGYFGPFGVDSFLWRDDAGTHWNRRSEINARYTMGWHLGMRGWRPTLTPAASA